MERAFELDIESAGRVCDEQQFDRKINFSPLFSSAKPPAGMAMHQQLGDVDFGPLFAQASGPCDAKELMMASTSSSLTLESPVSAACYLSANGNQSIAFGTSSGLPSRDGDSTSRADFWADGVIVPFDLHYPSPTQQQGQQQLRLQHQNPYSPMMKPALVNCGVPLGTSGFRNLSSSSTEDGDGDAAYQNDVASALSSLLEEDDRFAYRQNTASVAASRVATTTATTFADWAEAALPGRISVAIKPAPTQPRPWEQSATDPALTSSAATHAACSMMSPIKDECSLLSPTTAEKKVLVTDNDLRLLSSANACASSKFNSRLSSTAANATTWKEPIPFHAQSPFPGTSSVSEATTAAQYTAAMTAAPIGMHSDALSPFRQYAPNAIDRRPGYPQQQQQLGFQPARQHPFQSNVNSPAAHYTARRPVAPSTSAEAEQWRRQLMLRRSNAAGLYSGTASPFSGMAFATTTSTPPAASGVGSYSRTSGLAVPYQSPANKRARLTHSPPRFVGYGAQSAAGSRHRLVPPPPIPLQNGVDGVRSSVSAMNRENRAALAPPTTLWQGFPGVSRLSFAPMPAAPSSHARVSPPPFTQSQPRQIGIYSPQERRERIKRFLEKRKQRVFHKRIKYDCRKRLANACPRIKGRFVRRDEYLAAVESGQRVTHPHSSESIAS